MRPTGRPRAAVFLLALAALTALPVAPTLPAARAGTAGVPARVTGDVAPVAALRDAAAAAPRLYTTGDTVAVFTDSLEAYSSPSNEDGWTHFDQSGTPTAWHIASDFACEGLSFWCGIFDPAWTGDPDRKGYDNGWAQEASNFVDLTGALGTVRLAFRHHLNVEAGFDFARVEVLDDDGWIGLATYTGVVDPNGAAICDTVSITIPDSIVVASPFLSFRFVFTSDVSGSSADGLYPAAAGWSLDNVTVVAGLSDVRFFDDFEAGLGTWSVLTFPPVGDSWRIVTNGATEQQCASNTTKVWTAASAATEALLVRANDVLQSPVVAVNGADQVFVAFDVFRNLPFGACFYYGVTFRHRTAAGAGWSGWLDPTGLLYFGNEQQWLRQTLPLVGAGGADSVQIRVTVRDYGPLFCEGSQTATGTLLLLDNFAVSVVGLAGPSIAASERDLFQDTFKTSAFFADDNFNTPRGDSLVARIGASRGLKSASLHYSFDGAAFVPTPLLPTGTVANAYYADVPPGASPRGTRLRYYFSATDSLDETVTLPSDAIAASHYFSATILPAIQTPSGLCAGDTARVLYVNSEAPHDATTGVEQGLQAMGMRYDRYDVNGAPLGLGNGPGGGNPADPTRIWPAAPLGVLGAYSTIVWDVGIRTSATLSQEDQDLLTSWAALPGKNRNLLLAGDNLAYDLQVNGTGVPGFLSCTAGAVYVRDAWQEGQQDTLQPVLLGSAGTPVGSVHLPLNGGCPTLNRFDVLAVSGCAGGNGREWVRYPNATVAATERRAAIGAPGGDSARAVLAGYSFVTMKSAAQRNAFLWHTLVGEFEEPYCSTPTGVPERGAPSASAKPRLIGAAPNPFNPHTTIRFDLPRAAVVRLRVFDVSGRLVRVLADGAFPAGLSLVSWDGRDGAGRDAATGTYFYRLEAEGVAASRKLTLLR